ncbi:DUF2971 domain-containing protein [Clostridium gasigenes]|uniref:DUF2971 domain-containing protein n=1 Tax=Clostridium gasigenes TaxID=94869 RepID=A0A7X0SAC6_9CLOT|nr:DUF2971 domain-containing protein [Clostridium gasigenes]MBB6713899.1 DUF2971 domain-containing protein [Clostridium gasigenes]
MGFNMSNYIAMIEKRENYNEYRMKYIPKKLYKYIYLSDTSDCSNECGIDKVNNLKLNSLRNNEFWMSTCKSLNDPFELKTLFINEEKIKQHNYPIEYINALRESYYNGILIGCFTTNLTNNMPMWAHYANNHTGFCIEYTVTKPKFFYPISYEPTRSAANNAHMNCVRLGYKEINGTIIKKEKEELDFYNALLFHNSIIKNDAWKYENEFRLLFSTEIAKKFINVSDRGGLIYNKVLGIETTAIYLGMSCEKYKDKLINIGKELAVDVYQMYFEDSSENYELSYKEI